MRSVRSPAGVGVSPTARNLLTADQLMGDEALLGTAVPTLPIDTVETRSQETPFQSLETEQSAHAEASRDMQDIIDAEVASRVERIQRQQRADFEVWRTRFEMQMQERMIKEREAMREAAMCEAEASARRAPYPLYAPPDHAPYGATLTSDDDEMTDVGARMADRVHHYSDGYDGEGRNGLRA